MGDSDSRPRTEARSRNTAGVDAVFGAHQPRGEMSMKTEPGPTDNLHLEAANAMMSLLNGSWAARLVHAAAELGIADHLVGDPRNAAFLAAATQAHAPSLARLLRALTAIGVLNETDDRRYSLTQLGTTLRSD